MAYKNIAKGVSLAADHAKYLTWLQLDTGGRQAAYQAVAKKTKDKVIHTPGFIIPFAAAVASKVYLPRQVLAASEGSASNAGLAGAVEAAVASRVFTTAPFTEGGVELSTAKKFKFAKISVTQITAIAAAKSNSRITGRLYQKNTTSSVTANFGQVVAGEAYATATAAILASSGLAGLIAATTVNKTRYRFVPEGG